MKYIEINKVTKRNTEYEPNGQFRKQGYTHSVYVKNNNLFYSKINVKMFSSFVKENSN